jgi:LmeA-like phospholipid-binding
VRKILVFGCLLPLLLVASAGAYVYHLATWKPSPSALPPPPPPATAHSAHAKIEAVTRQVRRIRRAPRQRAKPRFHLALKEDEINGLLTRDQEVRQAVAQSGLRDARVLLNGDRVTVSGFTKAAGPEVYVSASGTVNRDAVGKLAVQVESVRVGQLAAPPALRKVIDDRVQQAVRKANRDLAARLDELRVGDGGLTVDGELRP